MQIVSYFLGKKSICSLLILPIVQKITFLCVNNVMSFSAFIGTAIPALATMLVCIFVIILLAACLFSPTSDQEVLVQSPPGLATFFQEMDREIFSTVIFSLRLIQEGQLSVSGESMCTSTG